MVSISQLCLLRCVGDGGGDTRPLTVERGGRARRSGGYGSSGEVSEIIASVSDNGDCRDSEIVAVLLLVKIEMNFVFLT